MSDWQPIETAPQTSKARLVWCPERQNTYIVSWSHSGEWMHFGGMGQVLSEEPTHWMPLPEPPKAPDPLREINGLPLGTDARENQHRRSS